MSGTSEPGVSEEAAPPARFVFGDFRLELATRQLYRADVHIPITTKAIETLLALVRRKGDVVSKDELISEVWPDTFVSEDSLTQNISTLRRVLEDDPVHPKYIATVARRGYRFIAEVTTGGQPDGGVTHAELAPSGTLISEPAAAAVIPPAGARDGTRWRAALLLLAGLAIGALATAAVLTLRKPAAVPEGDQVRFTMDLPAGWSLASGGTVSPDGRHVAFIARDAQSGETRLWVRTLSTATVQAVAGSEGALRPFWSPDSQSLAFFGGSQLRRVSLGGRATTKICDTYQPRPVGGSWNERDEILFGDNNSLFLVPARGGTPRRVLSPSPERQEVALGWPQFLPGGDRFLFEVRSVPPAPTRIDAGSLDGTRNANVLDGSGPQTAYTNGYLVYVSQRQVRARPFDAASLEFSGEEAVVAESVSEDAPISASRNAAVITIGGAAAEQVAWFDRGGRSIRTLNVPEPLRNLSIAPDQKTLLADGMEPARRSIWLIDLATAVPTRLTGGFFPVWAPDGRRIVFGEQRQAGSFGLYSRSLDRPDDELLLSTERLPIVNDFTHDGSYIIYVTTEPATRQDVWLLPTAEPKKPRLLLGSRAREIHVQVSPDGRWVAYASDEEGTFQVYIQAFPGLGEKRRVSSNGGMQPQWRRDGRELFYLEPDATLMSVPVSSGPPVQLGAPSRLFRTQLLGLMTDFRNQYTVAPDGNTFAVGTIGQGGARELINVIANWTTTIPR